MTTYGCYYTATIGTAELNFYGNSDSRAALKVARWVRLFWPNYVASGRAGSMREAIDRDADTVKIYRRGVNSAGVVQCRIGQIEQWALNFNDEQIAYFRRVSGRRHARPHAPHKGEQDGAGIDQVTLTINFPPVAREAK